MIAFAIPAVVALGTAGAVSSALNGYTGRNIGPLRGTYTFLAIGALISGSLALFFGELSRWGTPLEPYLYIPGIVNLLFIFTMVSVINAIGAMLTTSCIFFGQVAVSTWLDHIGFLGLPAVPATPVRLLALGAMIFSLLLLIASRQYAPKVGSSDGGPTVAARAGAAALALV